METAKRPYGLASSQEEDARPGFLKALSLTKTGFVRNLRSNRERDKGWGNKSPVFGKSGGKAREVTNPREHAPPPETNPFGRNKEDGSLAGMKPLECRWKADKVF